MSKIKTSIVKFTLYPHPNADTLSCALVLQNHKKYRMGIGSQALVRTEDFKNEKLGVYVPIDAVASSSHELLGFLDGKRIRTIRLRGEVSQGVLLPYSKAWKYILKNHGFCNAVSVSVEAFLVRIGLNVVTDLSNLMDVAKYVPKLNNSGRFGLGKMTFKQDRTEDFDKYTDIEHFSAWTDAIEEGEPVLVTEKLHGTSTRYGIVNGEFVIGTKRAELILNDIASNAWTDIATSKNIESKLRDYLKQHPEYSDVSIYGEIVGPKVQDLTYGLNDREFFGYDVKVKHADSGKMEYLNYNLRGVAFDQMQLKQVPTLAIGAWRDSYSNLRLGKDSISGTHVREGIVVEPLTPKFLPDLGRVKMKIVSEDFDLRNSGTDNEFDVEFHTEQEI